MDLIFFQGSFTEERHTRRMLRYVIDLSIILLAFYELIFMSHIMCQLILELIEKLLPPKPCKILKHDEVIFNQLNM